MIDLAGKAGKSDSDNKKRGNPQKVDEFRQAELEQYLEEALFLLELIGVRVFKTEPRKARKTNPRTVTVGTDAPIQAGIPSGQNKPPLPDSSLGPCAFAKAVLINLLSAGYIFTDEQMKLFGSVEGSKQYTTRNLPLFWILREGETRDSCDPSVRNRYWAQEFASGGYRFMMYSQWYDENHNGAHKSHIINWYNSL